VTEKFTEKLNLSSYALYLSDIGASVGFRLTVIAAHYAIFGAPNFTLRDNSYRAEGFLSVSNKHLMPEVLTLNPSSLGTDFQLPIFFFQGSDDAVTSASLAKAYFDQINAPQKEYVAMPGGHFAVWSYPDKFLKELDARVRPLATQSSR
jgi:pimeloyl-ACP methyl ester carboxylesterase